MYLTPFVQGPYEVPRTRRCEKGPPPITRQTSTSFVWSVVESLAVAKRSMIMRGTWPEVNKPSSSCSSFLAISSIFSGGQPGMSMPRRRPMEDRTRSEEHTSELQSLMRISYAVFCLKKKNDLHPNTNTQT